MENKPRYRLVKRTPNNNNNNNNNKPIQESQPMINVPELMTSIKRSLYSDIDARAKYWIEQRMGLLLNNNALMKKNTTELKIDYDNNSGGLSWLFKYNGSTVAYIDSRGVLYCSNILLNGINLLNAVNNIISINNDLSNLSDIYVRHYDLKAGTYKLNIKDIISETGTITDTLTSDAINTNTLHATGAITCDDDISADNLNITHAINTNTLHTTGAITCDDDISADNLNIAHTITSDAINTNTLHATGAITCDDDISADNLNITHTISADTINATNTITCAGDISGDNLSITHAITSSTLHTTGAITCDDDISADNLSITHAITSDAITTSTLHTTGAITCDDDISADNLNITHTITTDAITTSTLHTTTSITCDGPGLFTSLDIANNVKNTWYEKIRYEGNLANNEYLRLILKDLTKQGIIDFTRDSQYYRLKLYVDGGLGIVYINESGIEMDGVVDIHDDLTLWQKLNVNDIYAANTSITLHDPTSITSNLQVSGTSQLSNVVSITLNVDNPHTEALRILDPALTGGNGIYLRIGHDDIFSAGNSGVICFHYAGNNDAQNFLGLGIEGNVDLYRFCRDYATFLRSLLINVSSIVLPPIDITIPALSNGQTCKIRLKDGTSNSVFGIDKESSGYYTYMKNEGNVAEVRAWNNKIEITPTLTMNHDVSGFCDSSDASNSTNIDDTHLITAKAAKELNPFIQYPTHSIKATPLPFIQFWSCLGYSVLLNIWLILPNTSQYGAYSEDNGETWIAFDCSAIGYYRDVCWCDDVGQFFAVYDSTAYAMLSNTGKSYESLYNMGAGSHNWIACASGNGITIATNYDSSDIFYFQGGTHTRTITLANNYKMSHVVFGAGLFLGACSQYNIMIYSYDGITWGTCGSITNNAITDLFYGANGCFVQLTGGREYQVWRCKINLNQGNPGPQPFYTGATQYLPDYGNNAWYAGAYGNGRYVVMMNGGDKFAVNTNPIPLTDGWVLYDISVAVSLPRIKYGNGSFVIISQSSTPNGGAYILNFKQYKSDDIIISNNVRGDNEDRLEALEKQIRGLRYSILNAAYPIGSIYVNGTNNINPADSLGFGTWQAIEDRFLYCVAPATATGTTGGSATHTIGMNELPYRLWQFNALNDGGGYNVSLSDYLVYTVDPANFYGIHYSQAGWSYGNPNGADAFNMLPPYITVHAWIRTA